MLLALKVTVYMIIYSLGTVQLYYLRVMVRRHSSVIVRDCTLSVFVHGLLCDRSVTDAASSFKV